MYMSKVKLYGHHHQLVDQHEISISQRAKDPFLIYVDFLSILYHGRYFLRDCTINNTVGVYKNQKFTLRENLSSLRTCLIFVGMCCSSFQFSVFCFCIDDLYSWYCVQSMLYVFLSCSYFIAASVFHYVCIVKGQYGGAKTTIVRRRDNMEAQKQQQ